MQKVAIRGGEMAVDVQGSGRPILFIHGFPLDHTMWRHQVDAFRSSHRVIAPDLRGFGKSTPPEGVMTLRMFAEDLAAMLDRLDIKEPVVVCGLSMGGAIAWQFVQAFRSRVKALIQCDARAGVDTPEMAKGRTALAERVLVEGPAFVAETMMPRLFAKATFDDQPELIEELRKVIVGTDPRGVAAGAKALRDRQDMTAWLPSINVPTLLIVGEHDVISTADEMRGMAEAIPGAKYVKVLGAGHMAPLEAPTVVNDAIARFLNGLPD